MGNVPIPGDRNLHRYEVYKRVATRLRREADITVVNADPSLMRSVRFVATLDCAVFSDHDLDADDAALEFE